MKTYLAKWPNGTISILNAWGDVELFDKLDTEGGPLDAKIYCLPETFHLTTDIQKLGKKTSIDCDLSLEHDDGKMKAYKFPKDIFSQWVDAIKS